ncbi:MAG: monovalent cation/H(+) antiporter subunit G [Pigmentiphaga sp.]
METLRHIVSAICLVAGAFIIFSAALGMIRFPDAYTRMHAATKAGVVGAGSLLLGAALAVGTWGAVITALAGIFFLFATVTIAAHTLGRAAYLSGAPLAGSTVLDAAEDVYERHDFDGLNRPQDEASR